MPIYEYQCRRCGHRLEAMQRFSDPPRRRCPECGGGLKKLVSAPAFHFKGSGWYVTDYAGKKSAEGKGEAAAESKGDSKGDSKGEAKSESQGETKPKTGAAGDDAGSSGGGAGKSSKRPAQGASGAD
jgi:putative FmdB family regulatory protein